MAKTTRTSAAQWAERVRQWQQSGLGAAAYGAREGFDGKQLTWWKWHLGRRGAQGPVSKRNPGLAAGHTAVGFVPARIVDRRDGEGGRIEVVLANGRVLRVTGSVDENLLARTLRIAESGAAD